VNRSAPGNGKYGAPALAIWSALFAVYLIWGSTYLAIRLAVETIPPFLMAAVRFLVSGGFLFVLRRAAGDPAPSARQWRSASVVGILLLVGGNGGVVWAEQFVASALAALLVATVPLWMVVLDGILGGERPGLQAGAGILIGFCGVILLIGSPVLSADAMGSYGAIALLLASLFWAMGSIYGRNAVLPASQLLGTGMEMLTGGFALLVLSFTLAEWRSFDPVQVSARSALALLYLTVVGSGAFVAYVWLLRVAPLSLVSTYAYVNPLVAVVLGYFFAGEPLGARIVFAAGFIVVAVSLVNAASKLNNVLNSK
jgi:drug/metabolite transporter (DMT)-like permease